MCLCVCVCERETVWLSVWTLCPVLPLPRLCHRHWPPLSSFSCQHGCPIEPASIHQPVNEVAGLSGRGKTIHRPTVWSRHEETGRFLPAGLTESLCFICFERTANGQSYGQLRFIPKQTRPSMIYSWFFFLLLLFTVSIKNTFSISWSKRWIVVYWM